MRLPIARIMSIVLAFGAGVLVCSLAGIGLGPRGVPPATVAAPYQSQNFAVGTYAMIQQRARGTVGIARRGTRRVFASGVLIARNLVLTCRHCTHVRSDSEERHRWRRHPEKGPRGTLKRDPLAR